MLHRVAGALVLGFCAGCSPLMNAPPGFVDVSGGAYDFRAVSADGLVIAGREMKNSPRGDMAFWVKAIENELRFGRGYALLGSRDVKTAKGLLGRELRFGHDEGASPHVYWVAVFVTERKLYVVEAGGTRELVEQNEASLKQAISSLDAN